MIMVDFGNILKELRTQEGMTQQQLADRIGVTKSVISYYELQERIPSPAILVKLSAIFRVSTDFLLGIKNDHSINLENLDEKDIALVKHLVAHLQSKNNKQ
jgi:transcriptional regulator with XRE-family HTH domain